MKRANSLSELRRIKSAAAVSFGQDGSATYRDPLQLDTKIDGHETVDGDLIINGFVSTIDEDGHGDITLPSAFAKSIGGYMGNNPILLYNHDDGRAIGTVMEAEIVDGKGVRIKARIDGGETDIIRKIQKNILRTMSFGFLALKADDVDFISRGDNLPSVMVIKNLTWVETSIAPVPANKNAIFEIAKKLQAEKKSQAKPTTRPNVEEEAPMFTAEFKKSLGLAETATDAEVQAHIAGLQTKAASATNLEAEKVRLEKDNAEKAARVTALESESKVSSDKVFEGEWDGKLSADVVKSIKGLANRDEMAKTIFASMPTKETTAPPVGDPLKGTSTAAAPATKKQGEGESADSALVRTGLGVFETHEAMKKAALTSPIGALEKMLGTKVNPSAIHQDHDRQVIESRKNLYNI